MVSKIYTETWQKYLWNGYRVQLDRRNGVIVTFADIVWCYEAMKITIIIAHYVIVHLCCIKFP